MKLTKDQMEMITHYIHLRYEFERFQSYLRERGLVDENGVPVEGYK